MSMNPTPPVEARRLPPSAVLLLVANAAPLVGVLLHHWTVFAVLPVVFAAIKEQHLAYAVVALVLSHGFSFFHNYVAGGEYQRINLQQLMAQPYGRVVVLHLVVLGGGWVTLLLGSPVGALVLLVVLKTGFDLRAHLAERRKLSGAPVLPLASPPAAPA